MLCFPTYQWDDARTVLTITRDTNLTGMHVQVLQENWHGTMEPVLPKNNQWNHINLLIPCEILGVQIVTGVDFSIPFFLCARFNPLETQTRPHFRWECPPFLTTTNHQGMFHRHVGGKVQLLILSRSPPWLVELPQKRMKIDNSDKWF